MLELFRSFGTTAQPGLFTRLVTLNLTENGYAPGFDRYDMKLSRTFWTRTRLDQD